MKYYLITLHHLIFYLKMKMSYLFIANCLKISNFLQILRQMNINLTKTNRSTLQIKVLKSTQAFVTAIVTLSRIRLSRLNASVKKAKSIFFSVSSRISDGYQKFSPAMARFFLQMWWSRFRYISRSLNLTIL